LNSLMLTSRFLINDPPVELLELLIDYGADINEIE